MDKGRFVIETHLRRGRPIGELAPAHGVDRSWLFRLLARYRCEGPRGSRARVEAAHRSPSRIADLYEDEIVALRKELADAASTPGPRPSTTTSHRTRRSLRSRPSGGC